MEYLRFVWSFIVSLLINNWKSVKNVQFENILIMKLDHIGDIVWCLEAIRQLHVQNIRARITVLIGEWNVDVLKNNTDIDEVIVYNSPVFTRNKSRISNSSSRKALLANLRSRRFDLVVGFRDDMFTIWASLLIWPRFRADRGTVRIWLKCKNFLKNPLFHEYDTNIAIVDQVSSRVGSNNALINFTQEEIQWLDIFLSQFGLKRVSYIVLHPGASWEYRRWNIKNFESIAVSIFEKYGLKSLVVGTPDEASISAKLIQNRPDVFISVVGRTSLRELILILSAAKLVICNDSGPMHLASVMKIPTIALLGPQDVSRFGPRGENVIYFHKRLECHPCSQHKCKYPDNPCVDRNHPFEILQAIDKIFIGFKHTPS